LLCLVTPAALLLSGHDPNDYEIGRRVGLPTINIMNKDGSLNAAAGERRGARTAEWGVTEGCDAKV
jgi:valyl-tRNA synthetase